MKQLSLRGAPWPWLAVGCAHWFLTFFLEMRVFEVSRAAHLFDYGLCKLILLAVLLGFWQFVGQAVRGRGRARRVFLFALPCLAVLTVWLILYHPMVLEVDELNLYQHAIRLDSFAYWFNYFSGYYWIMSLMVLPFPMGPVLLKMFLQALVCGYCVTRQWDMGRRKWPALLLYLLFFLPMVLDQGISAHRLPTYCMLYLFLVAKLLYDHLEGKRLDKKTFVLLTVVLAILAIWRSEGIYLVPLGFLLLLVAYRWKPGKGVGKALVAYLLLFAVVAAPQAKSYFFDDNPSVAVRTKPLCGYLICNMFREGLTEEDLGEDYEAINAFLPIDQIHAQNAELGDRNYENALIMNRTDQTADFATQEAFCAGVKNVILRHPLIYLDSQWGAWVYLNRMHPLTLSEGAGTFLVNLSYQMWIPVALVFGLCLMGFLRKNWLVFWLAAGGVCCFAIVLAMMPATFPKYFYVPYLLGYFLTLAGIARRLGRGKGHG